MTSTPSPAGQPAPSAAVARVLDLARTQLDMDIAWLSELTSGEQVFRQVDDGGTGTGPAEGSTAPIAGSYCVRVLDGRLPPVVPQARREPRTRDLPVTEQLAIGAYVGAPVRTSDGTVLGMLCCTSRSARPDLGERDVVVLELLAAVLGELHQPPPVDLSEVRSRVARAVQGHGRTLVLQPIVDVRDGRARGAEALSRFSGGPQRPDLWFAEADRVGLRVPLELAAAADALARLSLPCAPDYVSINLSPDAVTSPDLAAVLRGCDPARVVVEVTEHAAVADYAAVADVLGVWRAAGLRLAVDDAGAGYASLRHVVQLAPDLIKIDMSLVRGIDADPVKQALAASLVTFARATGAELVAEGVETPAEYDEVARLGVTLVQGHLLARPAPGWSDHRYPLPGRLPDGPGDGVLLGVRRSSLW